MLGIAVSAAFQFRSTPPRGGRLPEAEPAEAADEGGDAEAASTAAAPAEVQTPAPEAREDAPEAIAPTPTSAAVAAQARLAALLKSRRMLRHGR